MVAAVIAAVCWTSAVVAVRWRSAPRRRLHRLLRPPIPPARCGKNAIASTACRTKRCWS